MERDLVHNNPYSYLFNHYYYAAIILIPNGIFLLIMNTYEFNWVYKYGDGYESLFSKIC